MESSPAQSAPAETKSEEHPLPTTHTRKARRPRGSGTIFRCGRFWHIGYYVASGRQVTESSRSSLKTAAQEMLRDRIEKVRQGLGLYCETPPRKVTFQTLADDLLDDYRINHRRSIKDVESRLKLHLTPYFGNFLAAAITTEKAKEYLLLRQRQKAKDGTIQQELALLKRMFSLASRATLPKVPRAPWIQMPRASEPRKGFVEKEGYVRLLASLPEYLRPFVTMAYSTGMRRGEIMSLRWENVDLLNRQVRLSAGETKNGEGRIIPLADELVEVLKTQLHFRNTQFPECPFVFFRTIRTKAKPVPSWLPIGDIRKAFEAACTAAGLTGTILHDLRRSAVRNMVRAGVQERVAMRISGHKTRSVFDRYNIVSEQDLTDAVRKLQKFQDAAEPACQPAPTETSVSTARSAFVN